MNIDELFTYEDIAKLTGVRVETLYVWKSRGQMPEPDLMWRGPLWYPATIEAWLEERRRA